jgi:phospholipase/carboxylesterase
VYSILRSMRTFAHALEALYPLHRLPPVGRYFAERPVHDRLDELDPEPAAGVSVGLHTSGSAQNVGERGGFCLYVPEYYVADRSWPLVVALHGGSGTGREYLWAWVREARSRGVLVLAPTARGPTWSMLGPDTDGAAITSMLEYVCGRWSVDRTRILLTGLSDGATYGLSLALREGSPFSAVAPVAGTLHPRFMTDAGISVARGKRIYLVHGALDWMFSVQQARFAHERLAAAGAEIVYREIADLSHTYPREENGPILEWFDPALGFPVESTIG